MKSVALEALYKIADDCQEPWIAEQIRRWVDDCVVRFNQSRITTHEHLAALKDSSSAERYHEAVEKGMAAAMGVEIMKHCGVTSTETDPHGEERKVSLWVLKV